MIRFVLLFTFAFVVELWLLQRVVQGTGFLACLGYHLISTFAFAVAVSKKLKGEQTRNLWVFCLSIWAFMPIVCLVIVAIFAYSLTRKRSRTVTSVHDVIESAEEEEALFRELALEMLAERDTETSGASLSSTLSQESFADILRSDNQEAKKKVITLLRFTRTPNSIATLKQAQKDKSYEIQYLSARALAAMEQEWHDELKILNEQIESDPTNIELRNQIVYSYMLIFGSGIVPNRIARVYLGHVLNHAVTSLQLDHNQADLLVRIGQINLFQRSYQRALQAFTRAIEMSPDIPQFYYWKAEAHYHLFQFDEVHEECRKLNEVYVVPGKILASVRYWSQNAG